MTSILSDIPEFSEPEMDCKSDANQEAARRQFQQLPQLQQLQQFQQWQQFQQQLQSPQQPQPNHRQQPPQPQPQQQNQQQPRQEEVDTGPKELSESVRTKVEHFDIHTAVQELETILSKTAELHFKIKDLKFKSLSQTYEMFARVDVPSIMLNNGRKEADEIYSSLKAVNSTQNKKRQQSGLQ